MGGAFSVSTLALTGATISQLFLRRLVSQKEEK